MVRSSRLLQNLLSPASSRKERRRLTTRNCKPVRLVPIGLAVCIRIGLYGSSVGRIDFSVEWTP
jgi:hypothetical protein